MDILLHFFSLRSRDVWTSWRTSTASLALHSNWNFLQDQKNSWAISKRGIMRKNRSGSPDEKLNSMPCVSCIAIAEIRRWLYMEFNWSSTKNKITICVFTVVRMLGWDARCQVGAESRRWRFLRPQNRHHHQRRPQKIHPMRHNPTRLSTSREI